MARADDHASDDSPAGNGADDRRDQAPDAVDLDAAVAELYGGPPATFVAGRDALARTLRTGGRRDDAAAVKALRKPRAVAWALDAGAHAAPAALAELAAAVEAVGDQQAAGGDVRTAIARLREAEAALADAATGAASDHGQAIDPATLALGLRAVVGDPAAFDALRAGRLVDVPTPGGLTGGLAVAAPPGAGTSPPAAPSRGRRARRDDSPGAPADAGARGARGSGTTAGSGRAGGGRPAVAAPPDEGTDRRPAPAAAARAARRAVAAARKQVDTAAEAARKAAGDADMAERAAQRAEDQAGAARRRADEARATAEAARRRADDRATAHREAEATLAAAEDGLASLDA